MTTFHMAHFIFWGKILFITSIENFKKAMFDGKHKWEQSFNCSTH
jgi:hypothetical protein